MLEFFMSMNPPRTTSQQMKTTVVHGKPRRYAPATLVAAKAQLASHLALFRPEMPMEGALRLTAQWRFPLIRKSKSGQYKTSRPDTDNLQKLLKDVMTSLGYWHDDAQVASETVEKYWHDSPGIYIRVEQIREV